MGRTRTPSESIHSLGCCMGEHLDTMNGFLEIIANNLQQGNVYNVSILWYCDDPNDTTTCRWIMRVEYADHTTQDYDLPCSCGDSIQSIVYIIDSNSSDYGNLVITHSDGTIEHIYIGVITNIDIDSNGNVTIYYADGSTQPLHVVRDVSLSIDPTDPTQTTNCGLTFYYADNTDETITIDRVLSAIIAYAHNNFSWSGVTNNINKDNFSGHVLITSIDGNGTPCESTKTLYFGQIAYVDAIDSGSVPTDGSEPDLQNYLYVYYIADGEEVDNNGQPLNLTPGHIYQVPIKELGTVTAVYCDGDGNLKVRYVDGSDVVIPCVGGNNCNAIQSLDSASCSDNTTTINYTKCDGSTGTLQWTCPSGVVGPNDTLLYNVIGANSSLINGQTPSVTIKGDDSENSIDYSNVIGIEKWIGDNNTQKNIRRISFNLLEDNMFINTNSATFNIDTNNTKVLVLNENNLSGSLTFEHSKINGGNGKVFVSGYKFFGYVVNKNNDTEQNNFIHITSNGNRFYYENGLFSFALNISIDTSLVGKVVFNFDINSINGSSTNSGGIAITQGYVDFVEI